MTAGIPGAGIGGLFYLASTILLPARNLVRRLRGCPETAGWRDQAFIVCLTAGILGALWATGWLLAAVVPHQVLTRGGFPNLSAGRVAASVIPLATFAIAVATLALVLLSVEVAHHVHARTVARSRAGR